MKKKKKWKKIVIIIVVIILLLTGVISCQVKQTKTLMETLNQVETAQVETKSIVNYVSATGIFMSETDVNVAAEITGIKVTDVAVAVGDYVKEGDVIATFDTEDIEKKLADAKESLNDAVALNQLSIQGAERNLQDTVRNSEFSTGNAKTEMNSAKTNYDNAVTDYNTQVAKLNQAQAEENTAAEERNQAKNDYDAAVNSETSAKAAAEKANKEYQEYLASPAYVSAVSAVESAANGVNIKWWISVGYYTSKGYADGTNTYSKEELQNGVTTGGVTIPTDIITGYVYYQALQKADGYSVAAASANQEYQSISANIATLHATYEGKEAAYKSAVATRESMQTAVTASERQIGTAKTAYDSMVNAFQNTSATQASTVAAAKDSVNTTKINANTMSQSSTVENLEGQLEQGVLKASKSGTVTAVTVKKGDTYAGGNVVTIQDTTSLYISSEIDQYYVSDIKEGMEVYIKTDATGDEELKGVIDKIAPTATPTTGNTVTYQVKIKLKEQNERLKIGMTARLSIITAGVDQVLAVPYGGVYTNEEGQTVLHLYDEETKETTDLPVTVGLEGDYYVEVSGEGVTEGLIIQVPNAEASNAMEELLLEMGGMGGM